MTLGHSRQSYVDPSRTRTLLTKCLALEWLLQLFKDYYLDYYRGCRFSYSKRKTRAQSQMILLCFYDRSLAPLNPQSLLSPSIWVGVQDEVF